VILTVTMLGLGFPYSPAQVGLTLLSRGDRRADRSVHLFCLASFVLILFLAPPSRFFAA
jgi:hypothetical protein